MKDDKDVGKCQTTPSNPSHIDTREERCSIRVNQKWIERAKNGRRHNLGNQFFFYLYLSAAPFLASLVQEQYSV